MAHQFQRRGPHHHIHKRKLSAFKGVIPQFISQIKLDEVHVDDSTNVSPRDVKHLASFDITKEGLVIPGSCPVWKDTKLPVRVPLDGNILNWRSCLPPCPLLPIFESLSVLKTLTKSELGKCDVIAERRNLRKLLDFVEGKSIKHRMDAEVIGRTLCFYDSWMHKGSLGGYASGDNYGRTFERYFTHSISPTLIEHGRVVSYTLGGLRIMVKYETDACIRGVIDSEDGGNLDTGTASKNPLNSLVPGADVLEIKTRRVGRGKGQVPPDNMEQLWFSQTPNIYTGFHDGKGLFMEVQKRNVVKDGSLKRWGERKAEALSKLAKLLEMIRDGLMATKEKKAALVFVKEKDTGLSVVKFHQFQPSYQLNSLPAEIRTLWFS